jgi:hypothetical protein
LSTFSDVKIVMTQFARGTVELDGVQLKGVYSIEFSAGTEQGNDLTLKMWVNKVEIESPKCLVEVIQTPQQANKTEKDAQFAEGGPLPHGQWYIAGEKNDAV